MNALVSIEQSNAEVYRASTDAAALCKEMVVASAMEIQKRKYVKVEGWMAIAVAHGCMASARSVERIDGGVRAIGEIRRMSDGVVVAEAEGFVGEDEPTWYGGEVEKDEWVNNRRTGRKVVTVLPKRADYAIRAMAQTRAISRACRSAFAHVVLMMNAGLSTTPAEEVPDGGYDDRHMTNVTPPKEPEGPTADTMAINLLRGCGRADMFKDAWEKNKHGWSDVMTTEEFGRVVAVKNELVAKWKAEAPPPAPAETPKGGGGSPAEPLGVETISDDEIPW